MKVRAFTILVVLVLISIPYLEAARIVRPEFEFGGFFLNPLDGNTYLAKMRQGWEGSWKFTLPYTAEPGEGTYFFIFYLFLGHATRVLGLPILLTFHLARVLSAAILFFVLDHFFRAIFHEERTATLAFCLSILGTGMGWLAALTGWVSADMWVAEAYPFLASFSNPHFPISMALMVWLLTPDKGRRNLLANPFIIPQENDQRLPKSGAGILSPFLPGLKACIGGFLLSLFSPFGVIVTGLVLTFASLWQWLVERKLPAPGTRKDRITNLILTYGLPLVGLAAGSAPVMVYDFWVARAHPALAGWNAQNIISTPAFWDIALSLSPALLFAIWGAWTARSKSRQSQAYRLLIVWALAGLLIFLPLNLQLRFMIGIYVPISALAVMGLEKNTTIAPRNRRILVITLFGLALPTLLIFQLSAVYSIQSRSNQAFLTQGEAQAMKWIEGNTPDEALILAGPDTGLLIPAHTGRRVIYGHPIETVNFEVEKESIENFYSTKWDEAQQKKFLEQRKVDFVYWGPREQTLSKPDILDELRMVYEADGVAIYLAK